MLYTNWLDFYDETVYYDVLKDEIFISFLKNLNEGNRVIKLGVL